MRDVLQVVEQPRLCSYLPGETASLEYRIVQRLAPEEYEDYLARGYRRFGRQLFRPRCPTCRECVSIRVLAQEFRPSASQRRTLRRNSHLRVVQDRVFLSDAHLALYHRYHLFMAEHRGWSYDSVSRTDYYESFVAGSGEFAWQWLFYQDDALLGVALMDETPNAVSLVYFFHEPEWRPHSPGTFAALTQLNYAREQGKQFCYPGYLIEANPSMAYKRRFRPFERLISQPSQGQEPMWSPPSNPMSPERK